MNYEAYNVESSLDNTRFQFQSIGKRDVFEKVIFITPLSGEVYNLSLVDYQPATGLYSDMSVTDNGDMREVLATVIMVILDVFDINPHYKLYFEGSTPSRTRLYQISISKIYDPITSDLIIQGYKDGEWLKFEPNINFEGFLIGKKL